MKTDAQIGLFLAKAKEFVSKHGVIFVDRDASRRFLADRNMTVRELEQIILSLGAVDCFDGPEPDRDERYRDRWTVAEFSPTHCGEKLYLKLSIRMDAERCKCLSVKLYTEK